MTNQQHPQKTAVFWGVPITINCDRQCNKAFGREGRPCLPNIGIYCGDDQLGDAPKSIWVNDGSESGMDKPSTPDEFPNEWCIRMCERSKYAILQNGQETPVVVPPVFPDISYLITEDAHLVRNVTDLQIEGEETLLGLVLPPNIVSMLSLIMVSMSPMQAEKVRAWASEQFISSLNPQLRGPLSDYPSWLVALIHGEGEVDDTIIPDIDEDDEDDYPTDH